MPLLVRYVDGNGRIQERFLRFIYYDTGTSGKALTDKIISSLTGDFNLNIMQCRDQCYDGAGNMTGNILVWQLEFSKEINWLNPPIVPHTGLTFVLLQLARFEILRI